MDLLSTGINAGVVAVVGLLVAWYVKGRLDALERRIDRLEERFDRRMDGFQVSLDAMRRDLTQIAMGVRMGPEGAA